MMRRREIPIFVRYLVKPIYLRHRQEYVIRMPIRRFGPYREYCERSDVDGEQNVENKFVAFIPGPIPSDKAAMAPWEGLPLACFRNSDSLPTYNPPGLERDRCRLSKAEHGRLTVTHYRRWSSWLID